MRGLLALVLITTLVVGTMTPAAYAGSRTDIALGLASFAVFNQVFGPLFAPRTAYATPIVAGSSRVAPDRLRQILLKAGRPRDFEDVISVLATQKGKLDERYIADWAWRIGVYDELTYILGGGTVG